MRKTSLLFILILLVPAIYADVPTLMTSQMIFRNATTGALESGNRTTNFTIINNSNDARLWNESVTTSLDKGVASNTMGRTKQLNYTHFLNPVRWELNINGTTFLYNETPVGTAFVSQYAHQGPFITNQSAANLSALYVEGNLSLLDGNFIVFDSDTGSDMGIYGTGTTLTLVADAAVNIKDTDDGVSIVNMCYGGPCAVAMRFEDELQYMYGANYNISAFANPGAGENPYFIQGGDAASTGIMKVGWQLGDGTTDWYRLKDVGSNAVTGLRVEMDTYVNGSVTVGETLFTRNISTPNQGEVLNIQPYATGDQVAVDFCANWTDTDAGCILQISGDSDSVNTGTIQIDQYGYFAFGGTNPATVFDVPLLVRQTDDDLSLGAGNNGKFYLRYSSAGNDHAHIATKNISGTETHNLIFSTWDTMDALYDFGFPMNDDPTFYIVSNNQSQNQYLKFQHNTTTAVIDSGMGGVTFPNNVTADEELKITNLANCNADNQKLGIDADGNVFCDTAIISGGDLAAAVTVNHTYIMWAERGAVITGGCWAFGNGRNNPQALIVPEDSIITSFAVQHDGTAVAPLPVSIYINGVIQADYNVSVPVAINTVNRTKLNIAVSQNDTISICNGIEIPSSSEVFGVITLITQNSYAFNFSGDFTGGWTNSTIDTNTSYNVNIFGNTTINSTFYAFDDGTVGIAEANPSMTLDVGGNTYIQGNLYGGSTSGCNRITIDGNDWCLQDDMEAQGDIYANKLNASLDLYSGDEIFASNALYLFSQGGESLSSRRGAWGAVLLRLDNYRGWQTNNYSTNHTQRNWFKANVTIVNLTVENNTIFQRDVSVYGNIYANGTDLVCTAQNGYCNQTDTNETVRVDSIYTNMTFYDAFYDNMSFYDSFYDNMTLYDTLYATVYSNFTFYDAFYDNMSIYDAYRDTNETLKLDSFYNAGNINVTNITATNITGSGIVCDSSGCIGFKEGFTHCHRSPKLTSDGYGNLLGQSSVCTASVCLEAIREGYITGVLSTMASTAASTWSVHVKIDGVTQSPLNQDYSFGGAGIDAQSVDLSSTPIAISKGETLACYFNETSGTASITSGCCIQGYYT